MKIWAIVPVKPLRDGKSRLAHILSADERAQLTTRILNRTLEVLRAAPQVYRTLVVSRDPAVLKLARQQGAYTFGEGEKSGLNMALTRAAHVAAAQSATGLLILPADLPLVSSGDVETLIASTLPALPTVKRPDMQNGSAPKPLPTPRIMAICPDRLEEGTNALYISPPTGFRFQFGAGSFDLHLQEGQRLGMNYHVVHSPGLKFDLDTEEDWYTYQTFLGETVPAP
jgi:2-phospho-L-lactate guanylyltransferase